jgi:DNA repair protein RadC
MVPTSVPKYTLVFSVPVFVRTHAGCSHLEIETVNTFALCFWTAAIAWSRLVELFRGTIDGASVHPREVVKVAIEVRAAAVVLDNYPSHVA